MLLIYLVLSALCGIDAARILGLFPTPAYSHQLPFQKIMKALAARGHQITVISPDPLKVPLANYTDVDLSFSYGEWKKLIDFNNLHGVHPLATMPYIHDRYVKLLDLQFSSPQLQAFIKFNQTFDLVFIERLFFPSYNGLIHHVGSPPVIGICSFGGKATIYTALGNPHNPSYVPDAMTGYSDHMTFWERMYNAYVYVAYHYLYYWDLLPRHEKLMREYFGSGPPPLYESEFNDSLLMVSNHWTLSYKKPLLPNIVELTGLHVETERKPLPKDIQKFLDGAEHGVVYFSLGSILRSELLPKDKVQAIVETFAELPQRVLWKWEADPLPGLPSNVMQQKWLPQQDILAHPNIRVFVTQGGLQSFQEGAYHGVPLIGIPFYGDQKYNVGKYVSAKIGLKVELSDLTKETFRETLRKLLNDSSYRNNMKEFSRVYREYAISSLEKAVWWTEYVLRHNGAHHLRSAATDLAWYQYVLLDVFAVLLLAIIGGFVISYLILTKIISFIRQKFVVPKLKKN